MNSGTVWLQFYKTYMQDLYVKSEGIELLTEGICVIHFTRMYVVRSGSPTFNSSNLFSGSFWAEIMTEPVLCPVI